MDKDKKIEERKKRNAPFLRVFDYLAKEKMMNQGQFAKIIDSESGYISLLRSGIKRVGADYIARIAVVFAAHFDDEFHLNPDYIDGKSQYMIIENVPDEEVHEKINRGANPDYDVIQKQQAASATPVAPAANIPDMSSVFNSALAAKDDAIASLKRELATKDDLIQSLRDQLDGKDALIVEQKARLIDYRRIIDSNNGISDYPFPIGAAEHSNKPNL